MPISPPFNPDDHASEPARARRRWDPVVKITHWSVVMAVIANALVTDEGSGAHIWVGYSLAAILALRLLWGLIGPAEARFSAFPPSPRRALDHLRDIQLGKREEHRSHNPLGALMVYAIWSVLGVIIASGIAMAGPPSTAFIERTERPVELHQAMTGDKRDHDAAAEAKDGEDDGLEEVHETAVNLLYVLVALHLAGVVFETRRSGREILLAMLPGRG